ncbi:SMC-Scp complex subunit ScpB [Akkermansiaceae bacterium]|nr:SMC-Scp complex subunit ScpB [Akkermansiaceae bacterium]MDB4423474.1 SMC-Scp complex subunit ScpB [bacterium]MDA7934894.1 SMC-Scp complex subunit ScpB [Akkermansiaceae bacterium]MDA9830996.1 SMC-Scp complex subunit ScpB [Akkermansiaceae bacterium]MDB4384137.1 SMC-Scp complex subunit ScpB [Akkermansiaceae bacterium]
MDLPSILESLLVASESPLPSPELARLVRARAAEFSEDSITENPENAPAPDSPERVLDLNALAEIGEDEVKAALAELNKIYEKSGRSFVVAERSKGWKIYTRADFAGFVKLLFPGRKPERLSPPAMETLAIIAYRQPVTKSALEAVRGVSCDGMLQKLLDRELVKISGRADLPGRPLLYATTELFLEHFGITDIEDLPNIGELRKVELPDGTEDEEDKKQETTSAEDAETQLALSAVEKPSNKTAEPSQGEAEEPPSEDSDSSEE